MANRKICDKCQETKYGFVTHHMGKDGLSWWHCSISGSYLQDDTDIPAECDKKFEQMVACVNIDKKNKVC